MNPAENVWVLKVARRHLSINKVALLGLVDMVEVVDNMDMEDYVYMVDSIDMINIQKAFGYL